MSFLQSRTRAAREGIGQPVPRKEDERLLRDALALGEGEVCALFRRRARRAGELQSLELASRVYLRARQRSCG